VLLGLFARGGLRIGLAILLAAISLSGVIGTYQHFESNAEGEAAQPALAQATSATFVEVAYRPSSEFVPTQEGEESEGGEGSEETPPPLAPLSLAGLSLMGAAILLAKQD
jgi:hypothetical protein